MSVVLRRRRGLDSRLRRTAKRTANGGWRVGMAFFSSLLRLRLKRRAILDRPPWLHVHVEGDRREPFSMHLDAVRPWGEGQLLKRAVEIAHGPNVVAVRIHFGVLFRDVESNAAIRLDRGAVAVRWVAVTRIAIPRVAVQIGVRSV